MDTQDSIPKSPVQGGFRYEVQLEVAIPIAWAQLLKEAAKHHYDGRCNEAGHHGVINGLFNTAIDGKFACFYPVEWRDLDLITKVAEQLEYHTKNHALIREIRGWLRRSMDTIEEQHQRCDELPESSQGKSSLQQADTALSSPLLPQIANVVTRTPTLRSAIASWTYEDAQLLDKKSPGLADIHNYKHVLEMLADGWVLLGPPQQKEWPREEGGSWWGWWLQKQRAFLKRTADSDEAPGQTSPTT